MATWFDIHDLSLLRYISHIFVVNDVLIMYAFYQF